MRRMIHIWGTREGKTYRGFAGQRMVPVPVPRLLQCQAPAVLFYLRGDRAHGWRTTPRSIRAPESTRSHHHPWLADSLPFQSRRASGRARIPLYCRPRLRAQITSVRHELKSCLLLCASVAVVGAADLLGDELARLDVVVSAGRWFAPDAGTGG
jgi:hypothetical protein